MTVLHYLEKTASRFAGKTAVSDKDGSFTFSQLRDTALSIAWHITEKLGGQTHRPILVYLPKSRHCIAAFMGIVYSGNTYTPIDVYYPFPKVRKVIDVLAPAIYISDSKNANKLKDNGVPAESILVYEDITDDGGKFDARKAISRVIDTDPVYILFTSGSTGIPKGVVICHRSIIDYIDWATDVYKIDDSIKIGSQAPFYFDNSTLDIYLCLKNGAEMYIIAEQYFTFQEKLMQTVAEQQISMIFWVPSVLISVANNDILSRVDCSCLKLVLFAGEVMPNKHLNYWRRKIPGALFSNLYGPTEITVDCIYYIVDRDFSDDEPLPIGFPCENSGVLLLDEHNRPVTECDVKGEICVRGSSLAHGYWNNPDKTQEAFCQNPLNAHYPEIIYRTGDLAHYNGRGEIMFDGRRDFQIKHLGHRIELGEIENAAVGIDAVTASCADYDSKKQEIVLFITGDIEEKALRKGLFGVLPGYMVPTRYIRLSGFPLNDNGKIDRIALRDKYLTKE